MIAEEQKLTLIGLFVLKLLDLEPEDGGMAFPVYLPHELEPFEPVLERLTIQRFIHVDRRSGQYKLTPEGIDYLGTAIDEAETYIEEFDGAEAEVVVSTLRTRNLDPLRVRFLWGWYQGEFDDPVVFQQRRGAGNVEDDWATYLLTDGFFDELRRDLE